jgi:hypothetical protein
LIRVFFEGFGDRVEIGRNPHPGFHSGICFDIYFDLVRHTVPIFVLEVSKVQGAAGFGEYHANDSAEFVECEIGLHVTGSVREEGPENCSLTTMHPFLECCYLGRNINEIAGVERNVV